MSEENWEALFKLKQRDWVSVCKELDDAIKERDEARAEAVDALVDKNDARVDTEKLGDLLHAEREKSARLVEALNKVDLETAFKLAAEYAKDTSEQIAESFAKGLAKKMCNPDDGSL